MRGVQLKVFVAGVLLVTLASVGCVRKRAETETPESDQNEAQADTAEVSDTPPAEVAEVTPEAVPAAVPTTDAATVAQPAPTPTPDVSPIPTPTVAETPPPPASPEYGTYSVKRGDTLMKIAFSLYGDIDKWKDIFKLNSDSIHFASRLKEGQMLKYEKPSVAPTLSQNGDPYMIKNGDTLGKIAKDLYGQQGSWRKLFENNKQLIKNPNRIFAGFYLYYQITEAEKAQAEKLKSTQVPPQTLGLSAPTSEPESKVAPAAPVAVPSAPTAVAPENGNGSAVQTSQLKPWAAKNRAPASIGR